MSKPPKIDAAEINRLFKEIYTDDVLKQILQSYPLKKKKKLYTEKEWKKLKKTNLGRLIDLK